MNEVTDPALLAQLEGSGEEVTDPVLLAQLEGAPSAEPAASQPGDPDSAVTRRLRALAQTTIVPAAQIMSRPLAATAPAFKSWAPTVGEFMASLPGEADQLASDLRNRREAGKPSGPDVASFEGEMAGLAAGGEVKGISQALAKYLPKLVAGGAERAAQGAVGGAQLSGTNEAGLGQNAGAGAVASAVLPPVLSTFVKPAANASVDKLTKMGVKLTPGQILGPTAKRLEDASRSIPLLGDLVANSQQKSFGSFNNAVINDALAPIRQKLPSDLQGREAIAFAQDKIGNAYESLLPQLKVVADKQFVSEVQGMQKIAESLPPKLRPDFEHILNNEVLAKFTPDGRMSGAMMKDVESELGQLAKSYGSDKDPFVRRMAGGVREAQRALRELVNRSNPEHAGELQAINAAYAKMARVNEAAARVTSEHGIFTPEAFSGAVKKGDASRGKRSFARGGALSQDVSDAAREVMGNKVPDSGTARRMMAGAGLFGGAGFIEPTTLSLGALAAAPYLPVTDRMIRAALLKRPPGARELADALRNHGGPLAVVGGSAVTE